MVQYWNNFYVYFRHNWRWSDVSAVRWHFSPVEKSTVPFHLQWSSCHIKWVTLTISGCRYIIQNHTFLHFIENYSFIRNENNTSLKCQAEYINVFISVQVIDTSDKIKCNWLTFIIHECHGYVWFHLTAQSKSILFSTSRRRTSRATTWGRN